jgi:ABC-type sugar transport system substrate-binding protein
MPLVARLVPFVKDRAAEVAASIAPLLRAQFESFPAAKREQALQTLLGLWSKNDAALVVQFEENVPRGVAMVMTASTVLHECDALALHFQPAPGGAAQLIDMMSHVALARGATGIALNLPSNPLAFEHIEELTAAGWKAKSVTYGKGLA